MSDSSGTTRPPIPEGIAEIHLRACEEGKSFYIDPITGYQVTTEFEHLKRGKCCRSGCRHCPYGFIKVTAEPRKG